MLLTSAGLRNDVLKSALADLIGKSFARTRVVFIPTASVAHNHYEMLWRLASRPEPARTRIELDIANKFIPGPIIVNNVIGEIRGSEKPDEVVVVGAHLDSWDLGQGTTDNGTGTCIGRRSGFLLLPCRVLFITGQRNITNSPKRPTS